MKTKDEVMKRDENVAVEPQAKREVRVEPAADVFRDAEGVRLLVDLPGVAEDGLNVQLHDGVLKIEGKAERGAGVTRLYQRAFRVDRRIDAEAIQAKVRQGVLTLRLPFRAEAQPRRIQVLAE
jgi:HSP20 family protein